MPMRKDIKIRMANREDVHSLSELGKGTFAATYREHFERDFSLVALDTYLHQTFAPTAIQKELNEIGCQFFIAENQEGFPVGYMKVGTTPAPLFVPGNRRLCLERIYLVNEYQSMGLGMRLVETAIEYAQKNHFETLWLGCWDGNLPTLRFYEKMGFSQVGSEKFVITGTHYSDTDLILFKFIP